MTALPLAPAPVTGAALDAPPAAAVMRLVVSDFRSYRRAEMNAPAGPVVLVGANGVGKTNLLEALSFLAPGRGLRRARLAEIERRCRPGERDGRSDAAGPGWAVFAEIAGPGGSRTIGTGRDPERAPGDDSDRRVVRIDGAAARSQTALADIVHVLWLTPEMDRLFDEGAGERRRFLDRTVYGFVPDHVRNLGTYEQAMRERNRLLADGRTDEAWLGALERSMAEAGVAVAAARRQVAARLALAAEAGIGGFPVPEIAIAGETEAELAAMPALAAEEALARRLAGSRRADAEAGRTLVGPHRSDLAVRHRAKDMPAALCSTGEQKALLIALTLAAARLMKLQRGTAPILLLDEVAAHLDAGRRAALFDEICALGAQAWITGTDITMFEAFGARAAFFAVADGALSPLPPPGP